VPITLSFIRFYKGGLRILAVDPKLSLSGHSVLTTIRSCNCCPAQNESYGVFMTCHRLIMSILRGNILCTIPLTSRESYYSPFQNDRESSEGFPLECSRIISSLKKYCSLCSGSSLAIDVQFRYLGQRSALTDITSQRTRMEGGLRRLQNRLLATGSWLIHRSRIVALLA
jgi:hypothetical protein